MSGRKDIERLLVEAERQGFTVVTRASRHRSIFTKTGEFVSGSPSTPSDYRGYRNVLSKLKRHGFKDRP